jgi:hypothetical protein
MTALVGHVYNVELEWSKQETVDGVRKPVIVDSYRGPALLVGLGLSSGKGEQNIVLQFLRSGVIHASSMAGFTTSVLREDLGPGEFRLVQK